MSSSNILFNPKTIDRFYNARTTKYAQLGAKAGLTPANSDSDTTLVILVDILMDFVSKRGNLPVKGAIEDTARTLEFIYNNAARITTFMPIIDTHYMLSIFFVDCWIDPNTGKHPKIYTVITSADVMSRKWVYLFDYNWALYYTQTLEAKGRSLIIWPYHTMDRTAGNILVPAISEVLAYHSAARSTRPIFQAKGIPTHTEYYGAYGPEVQDASTKLNDELLEYINIYKRRIYVGQAADFCVLTSVQQDVEYCLATNRLEDIKKIIILTDCISPVFDFPQSEYAKLESLGVTLTDSLSLSL